MVVTKPGEIMQYEGVQYSIGDWFVMTKGSDYEGLTGIIMKITDEEDGFDIFCNLSLPTEPEEIERIEKRFSKLYGEPMKLCDILFEGVVVAPDEIYVIPDKPSCYNPEKDNPYPLCVGNGTQNCEHCCLYANLDYNRYE